MNNFTSQILKLLRRSSIALSFGGNFRTPQSVLRRCFRHAKGIIRVNDFDTNLTIDLSLSECMQRRIFWMGYYNLDIVPYLQKTLKKGMTFIDIGANIGELSMVAAKCVGSNGKVFAFEPMNSVADKLAANIRRNVLNQIEVLRIGLSDKPALSVPIYSTWDVSRKREENQGLGSLFHTGTDDTPADYITISTLDAWLDSNPVDRLDIIKLDIEGAELFCLKGAVQTLIKFRPKIIVEIQAETASAAGYKPSEILDFLSNFGYRFFRLMHRGKLLAVTAATLENVQNVLCIPHPPSTHS